MHSSDDRISFIFYPHEPTQAAMMAVITLVYDDVNHHEAPCLAFRLNISDSV
jgi:hypothetical protein